MTKQYQFLQVMGFRDCSKQRPNHKVLPGNLVDVANMLQLISTAHYNLRVEYLNVNAHLFITFQHLFGVGYSFFIFTSVGCVQNWHKETRVCFSGGMISFIQLKSLGKTFDATAQLCRHKGSQV